MNLRKSTILTHLQAKKVMKNFLSRSQRPTTFYPIPTRRNSMTQLDNLSSAIQMKVTSTEAAIQRAMATRAARSRTIKALTSGPVRRKLPGTTLIKEDSVLLASSHMRISRKHRKTMDSITISTKMQLKRTGAAIVVTATTAGVIIIRVLVNREEAGGRKTSAIREGSQRKVHLTFALGTSSLV